MKEESHHASGDNPAQTGGLSSPMPDCRWNLKDPRSCMEPDSCGCYVDPCEFFGLSPEACCVDADILCGDG